MSNAGAHILGNVHIIDCPFLTLIDHVWPVYTARKIINTRNLIIEWSDRMTFGNNKRRIKRLSADRSGDVLGMPLYLFILIIITVIGLGILLAWLANVDDPPSTIEVRADPNFIELYDDGTHGDPTANDDKYSNDDIDITVQVEDNNGKPVGNVLIKINGMGIQTNDDKNAYGTTDGEGEIIFNDLKIIDTNKAIDINIEAEKDKLKADTVISTVEV